MRLHSRSYLLAWSAMPFWSGSSFGILFFFASGSPFICFVFEEVFSARKQVDRNWSCWVLDSTTQYYYFYPLPSSCNA